MAEKNRKRIIRCSQCGSLLDKKARMNKIFSDADLALDRFYNRMRKKGK
jgi:hypothetical protein|tara:strand:- start:368 stop:514 length:147 start_codon:yes stop_codon:yes gene_type:complete